MNKSKIGLLPGNVTILHSADKIYIGHCGHGRRGDGQGGRHSGRHGGGKDGQGMLHFGESVGHTGLINWAQTFST